MANIGAWKTSRNIGAWKGSYTTIIGEETYYNLKIDTKSEEIANVINAKAMPVEIDTSATNIFRSSEEYVLVGTTLDVTLKWNKIPVDPSTVTATLSSSVGASSITSENYYVWGGYITVTGAAGDTFTISATGNAPTEQDEIEYSTEDSGSIIEYGRKIYNFPDNHLMQTYDLIETAADNLLTQYAELRKDAEISWPGDTITELSDTIDLVEYEDQYITTRDYFSIIRNKVKFNGALDIDSTMRRLII